MADVSHLIPKLPFDTLALFEPTSGMMILNVDAKAFTQSAQNFSQNTTTPEDNQLFSTINHETYHYLQTVCSGYQYQHASEIWGAIVDAGNSQVQSEKLKRLKDWFAVKGIQLQFLFRTRRLLKRSEATRLAGLQDLIDDHQRAMTKERAAKGDLSTVSADTPKLARRLDESWAKLATRGSGDLAAIDLIEGSAIVFEHLLTYGRESLEERLEKAWEDTGTTYRRAFEVAQEICGPRALDLLLPATALALRYSNPVEAYPVLLRLLNASQAGNEIAAAHALAANPPSMGGDVRYLGTAVDVRQRQPRDDNTYRVYDGALDKLQHRAWDFDELDLLCSRDPVQKLGSFPFVTMLREGPLNSDLDTQELVRRLACASIVLRTQKLPRYRRQVEQRLVTRFQAGLGEMIDPLAAADQFNLLGLDYLNDGNLDQAEAMMRSAMSIYESHQHKQGIARELYNLGLVYTARKDPATTEKMYRQSLEIAESISDEQLIAISSANLGSHFMKSNRLDEAEPLIRRAGEIEEKLGLKEGAALDYLNLGRIAFARENFGNAREMFAKAVILYRDVGNESMAREIERGLDQLVDTPSVADDGKPMTSSQ